MSDYLSAVRKNVGFLLRLISLANLGIVRGSLSMRPNPWSLSAIALRSHGSLLV